MLNRGPSSFSTKVKTKTWEFLSSLSLVNLFQPAENLALPFGIRIPSVQLPFLVTNVTFSPACHVWSNVSWNSLQKFKRHITTKTLPNFSSKMKKIEQINYHSMWFLIQIWWPNCCRELNRCVFRNTIIHDFNLHILSSLFSIFLIYYISPYKYIKNQDIVYNMEIEIR